MQKAIILSNVETTEEEFKLLRDTDVYKLALNYHASKYNPDARIFTDYVDLINVHQTFPNDAIYTVRCKPLRPIKNVETVDIEFKGSTIIAAIDFLIKCNTENILLVADNTVHSQNFRDEINKNILSLKTNMHIYQFKVGNFPLPTVNVRDFLWNI